MRTIIIITGGISGNYILRNKIRTINSKEEKARFNGFKIIFNTKKEAVKTLSDAYQSLRAEEPDYAKYGILYTRGCSLSYDQSEAVIVEA